MKRAFDNLIVTRDGVDLMMLNPRLVESQGLNLEEIEELRRLHLERYEIISMMKNTDDISELRYLEAWWTKIQFELQKSWRFTEDEKFHRFWEVPKCTCPKMDNSDMYPHVRYINTSCPVHGENL